MLQSRSTTQNEAVQVINPDGLGPVVVICEHASNVFPADIGTLGLSDEAQRSHIAWDPGALAVAQGLSRALDAPLVAGAASRLLFDCNRPPEAADAIPPQSELFEVPGNIALTSDAAAERVRRFHDPFNAALRTVLDTKAPQVIVTVHSFTPVYYGTPRAVEIGVLHDTDSRLADAMLACAADHVQENIGRNDPYGPEHGVTHTLRHHALPRGALNVMLEIRNDLIADRDSQRAMAGRLAQWIASAMAALDVSLTPSEVPCPH
ncbi:N-formylglutamate amidohydrolase [Thalassovita taeanensis]|nr:N-formylglutamate amidohydrolase [Thalassovita taeanensis]